jgi:hypothetical protein
LIRTPPLAQNVIASTLSTSSALSSTSLLLLLFKVIAVEEEEEEVGFVIALLEREKSDIFSFSQQN